MKIKFSVLIVFICLQSVLHSQTLIDAIYEADTIQIKKLVEDGVNINERDEDSIYPLYWAEYLNDDNPEGDYKAVYDLLVSLGAIDFNANYSVFFEFCEYGQIDSIKKYLKNGFDINSRYVWQSDKVFEGEEVYEGTNCFKTALSFAAISGNLELVKYLVDNGAEINFSSNGVQPLSEAIKAGNYDIADYLLEQGAEKSTFFELDDNLYSQAIDAVTSENDSSLLNYLIENEFLYFSSYDKSPLDQLATVGDTDIIKKMLPVLDYDYLGQALCFAYSLDVAKFLLDCGADVNNEYVLFGEGGYIDYFSPIINATADNDIEYTEFLIKKNIELNKIEDFLNQDAAGILSSPLMNAVKNENIEMIKLLLENKANANILVYNSYDDIYLSPLILAVQKNNFKIVKFLVNNGANVINNDVSTIDYVTNETNPKIIKFLKKNIKK